MAKLLLLFTLVPMVELVLLLEVGHRIGTAATLFLILFLNYSGSCVLQKYIVVFYILS